MYNSGTYPGTFDGMAKLYRIDSKGLADDLYIRPIISNINTASYNLSKCLAKLMTPLSESQNTINSTKEFMNKIKNEKFQMDIRWVLLI